MNAQFESARRLALIDDLRGLPAETPWVEFKENVNDPQILGRLISALSNAARLHDQHFAYVLWGVRDADHSVVSTSFEPSSQKSQGQPLELWLAQRLQPSLAFSFQTLDYQGSRLVLLEIPAASSSAVEFERCAYVRMCALVALPQNFQTTRNGLKRCGRSYSRLSGNLDLRRSF